MKDRRWALRRHHRWRIIAKRLWVWRYVRFWDILPHGRLAKGNYTCSCHWCKGDKRLNAKRLRLKERAQLNRLLAESDEM